MALAPRLSRWLGVACLGTTYALLLVGACSVPEFEFPDAPQGVAGDGNVPIDHCVNGLLDADLGESDYDCGGGCPGCGVGEHCADTADCAAGLCSEGSCIAEGCLNEQRDGSETDVDCGGDGCNPCSAGERCALSTDCIDRVCVGEECLEPACDDQVQNGRETDVDCGGDCSGCAVDRPCVSASDCASLECNEEICGPECPGGFANCDGRNANGCELNTRGDEENCGACRNVCDLPNAAAECSAGECRIRVDGCEPGFDDCNGLPEDGCEVHLEQDALNCGACSKVCPELNGAAFCEDATCQITCSPGFDDCDGKVENGCEKDLSRDVSNCGECERLCEADPGSTPFCKNGDCGQTTCPAGFGDCNGEPDDGPRGDGCEADLRGDVDNCGRCGGSCGVLNGAAVCSNQVCRIQSCDDGFDDCSGGYEDGCETNLNTSSGDCGVCGRDCSIDNGSAKCDAGACVINSCSGTFRDCNRDASDGCEVNILTSADNCGACGEPCGDAHAAAGTSCADGVCQPSCDSGWGACVTPEEGCSSPLFTAQHCRSCVESCSGTTPFCDAASGCVRYRDIVVGSSGIRAASGWAGGDGAAQLAANHTLSYAKGSDRLLLVGVANSDQFTPIPDPSDASKPVIAVTYDGKPMLRAHSVSDAGKQSWASVYYLLDADLPAAAGTTSQLVVKFWNGSQWGHGGFDLIELKNATQAAPFAWNGASGGSCGASSSRGATVTFPAPGADPDRYDRSLVYGVLAARGGTSATLNPAADQIQTWNHYQATPDKLVGAAARVFSDSTRTLTWTVPNCYSSAALLVAIQRLTP